MILVGQKRHVLNVLGDRCCLYNFSIGFWNCSDSLGFVVFRFIEEFWSFLHKLNL